MATWRDGAEYAPTERPEGFAAPSVDPFPPDSPWRTDTPGAVTAPRGFDEPPAPPLAELAVQEGARRDPRDAFAVSSMTLTSGARAVGGRDPREPFATSTPSPLGPAWTSTEGSQLPPPAGPRLAPPGAPLPAPGQPQRTAPGAGWPAPSMPAPAPRRSAQPTRTQGQLLLVAAGLSLLAFLVPVAAPFLLVVSGILGIRTVAITGRAGIWALTTGLVILGYGFLSDTLGEPSLLGSLGGIGFAFAFAFGWLRLRRGDGR